MAIINQDWISEGINACTSIKAFVKTTTNYEDIKGHFVPVIADGASPLVSPGNSNFPAGVVMEKCQDNFDPILGDVRNTRDRYAVRLQVSGIAAVNYTSPVPTVGTYVKLGPDGKGGVKVVESGGREFLVVGVNTITKQIWIVL